MSRILIFYFLIYSLIHFVMYLRFKALWPRRKRYGLLFAAWAVIMILTPVASRIWDGTGWTTAAWLAAWAGFLWMGFAILVLWVSLAIWLIRFILWAAARLAGLGPFVWPARAVAWAVLAAALGLSVYAYSTARSYGLDHVIIKTDKLPASRHRLKIAVTTDLHLSPIIGPARLGEICAQIKQAKPDLVLDVGDVVDRNPALLVKEGRILAGVTAPLGKFSVLGNHEFYIGAARSQDFLERAGFIVLRNRAVVIDSLINIAGVDDPGRSGRRTAEKPLLSSLQNGLYTILLKHRPWVDKSCLGLFDLQISGHTHGGQMWPFSYVVRLIHGFFPGLHQLSPRSWLYLSRGTGFWGPPTRFLVPPEITLIELVRTPPDRGPRAARPPMT